MTRDADAANRDESHAAVFHASNAGDRNRAIHSYRLPHLRSR
jgi:hypothetical protein